MDPRQKSLEELNSEHDRLLRLIKQSREKGDMTEVSRLQKRLAEVSLERYSKSRPTEEVPAPAAE